jgi:hypothetical protein
MFSSLICMFFQWHVFMLCAYCHGTQAENIPRSLFSFSPHGPDQGGVQEEVIWKELVEASMALEEVMNNHKHVCVASAWPLVYI